MTLGVNCNGFFAYFILQIQKKHHLFEQFHGSCRYQNEDNSLPFEELKKYPCSLDLLFLQYFGTLGYNNIVGVDKLTKKIRTFTDNKKDIFQRTRNLVSYSKSLAYMQLHSQIGLCYNFTAKTLICLYIRQISNLDIE